MYEAFFERSGGVLPEVFLLGGHLVRGQVVGEEGYMEEGWGGAGVCVDGVYGVLECNGGRDVGGGPNEMNREVSEEVALSSYAICGE